MLNIKVMNYWKGRKRGPQSPEHKAKTVINLKPGYGKGMKFPERSGDKNTNWTGDKIGYWGIHQWLQTNFGKSNKCENPDCLHISIKFHWALIKGKKYERKRENFWMLCTSCHAIYDEIGFPKGHQIGKGNTFRRIDLIGQRFGKLIVISLAGKNKWGNLKFLCKCDCGKEKIVPSANLRDGRTKSCGCIAQQLKIGNKFRQGKIPWNKGKKLHYIVWAKNKKGVHWSPKTEFKKGMIPWNKGLKLKAR